MNTTSNVAQMPARPIVVSCVVTAESASAGPVLREIALRSAPELARVSEWSQAERRYEIPDVHA